MEYGFFVEVDGPMDDVVDRFIVAMKAEGFGTLVDIDVRTLLKEKIGEEIEGYRLLGVCNPALAHKATTSVPDIGLFLPCGALARELPSGRVRIGVIDPVALLPLLGEKGVSICEEMATAAAAFKKALAAVS
ncbi:DUF302 domain-containing protein [bacterium]|nr:DUF302 domain-containing protein [bacterium]